MPEGSARGIGGAVDGKFRFDGQTVRHILERAAQEQHRLDNELADSYSLEDLEEMAAEAGISLPALHAAIGAHQGSTGSAARSEITPRVRPRDRLAALESWIPGFGSVTARRVVLTSMGGVAVVGLLLAFPAVAEVLIWGVLLSLIVLSVLVLLGASPF